MNNNETPTAAESSAFGSAARLFVLTLVRMACWFFIFTVGFGLTVNSWMAMILGYILFTIVSAMSYKESVALLKHAQTLKAAKEVKENKEA